MADQTEHNQVAVSNNQAISRLIRDPGAFSGKRTKFGDWWRIMMLFLKFNNITQAKHKIALVASRMEGGVQGFHAKQQRIIKGGDTASWDSFEEETKQAFGIGNKEEIARNQIKEFKQGINTSMTSSLNLLPSPKWQELMIHTLSSYSNNTPNTVSSKQSWDIHLLLSPKA
jgi:hypothetical protein